MTHILKLLRHQQAASERGEPSFYTIDIWRCAADEIERLQALVHKQRAVIDMIADIAEGSGIARIARNDSLHCD